MEFRSLNEVKNRIDARTLFIFINVFSFMSLQ